MSSSQEQHIDKVAKGSRMKSLRKSTWLTVRGRHVELRARTSGAGVENLGGCRSRHDEELEDDRQTGMQWGRRPDHMQNSAGGIANDSDCPRQALAGASRLRAK